MEVGAAHDIADRRLVVLQRRHGTSYSTSERGSSSFQSIQIELREKTLELLSASTFVGRLPGLLIVLQDAMSCQIWSREVISVDVPPSQDKDGMLARDDHRTDGDCRACS